MSSNMNIASELKDDKLVKDFGMDIHVHKDHGKDMSADTNTMDDDDEDFNELQKKVQEELEVLNSTANEINALEKQLDDSNGKFRSTLQDATHDLKQIAKKAGKSVDKARPYYVARDESIRAQIATQQAAQQYQRAVGIHQAAKETIALAEERLTGDKREFDSAWQEMLNHATIKVNTSETEKNISEAEHQRKSSLYTAAKNRLVALERKLKSEISKSKPYFDQKSVYEKKLRSEKLEIDKLQAAISVAKRCYSRAMTNLEKISNEEHEKRKGALQEISKAGTKPLFIDSTNLDAISLNFSVNDIATDESGEVSEDSGAGHSNSKCGHSRDSSYSSFGTSTDNTNADSGCDLGNPSSESEHSRSKIFSLDKTDLKLEANGEDEIESMDLENCPEKVDTISGTKLKAT